MQNEFELPSDRVEAIGVAFERYKRLANDRRWTATRITDIYKNAKKEGMNAAGLRLAHRISKMSGKRLTSFLESQSVALGLFGHGLEIDVSESDNRDWPEWGVLQEVQLLDAEKVENREQMKMLKEACEERDIDFTKIQMLAKLEMRTERDNDGDGEDLKQDLSDWWHDVDDMGVKAGLW